MAKKPSLEVVKESETGLNTRFLDNKTGENISRSEATKRVKEGKHPDYHVRKLNDGREIPVSNPDGIEGNNLG